MSEPLEVAYFTDAAEIRQLWTEEAVAELPSFAAVTSPEEGRGKLAAALLFHLQYELERERSLFTIVDKENRAWTFHAQRLHGVRVLEPLTEDEPRVGFRAPKP